MSKVRKPLIYRVFKNFWKSAKNAVVLVPKSGVTKVLVQEAANQLSSTSRSVETYRAEMEHLASMLPEYPVVMEMYGVGKSFGPQFMAEIGDVRRFERKQSLVAFAGIDPMPNQSGDKNVRSNKSSKRGPPYLRKTLFNVMGIYLKCAPLDEPVFQFLDRKRSEGKPFCLHDRCIQQVPAALLRKGAGLSGYLGGSFAGGAGFYWLAKKLSSDTQF